jgi:hypothetical protein
VLTKHLCDILVEIYNQKIPRYLPFKSRKIFIYHRGRIVNNDIMKIRNVHEIIPHTHCSVDEKKYIPCVPHKNNYKNKIGSHDMKQT